MAPLFRNKAPEGSTVVIADVENGSVGAALVHLRAHEAPKIFGQMRERVPVLATHDAHGISREIARAAQRAFLHAQEVAARLRTHEALSDIGALERGMIFLHAPWSALQFDDPSKPDVTAIESFLYDIHGLHAASSGDLPVSYHSFGGSAAPMLCGMYGSAASSLVCSVSGEITELFSVREGSVVGYGTIPFGVHTLLRTLHTHAGLSHAESYSAMRIAPPHVREATDAAARQFAQEFADTTHALFLQAPATAVLVLAQEPFGEWFARALTRSEEIGRIFKDGGVVRAVRAEHVSPFVAAHASVPDLQLMLGGLFADARFNTVY